MARMRGVTVAAVTVLALSACATSVPGRAIRAPGGSGVSTSAGPTPGPPRISAQGLLLQDGATTPLGPAKAAPVGTSYFTSARPPECTAALLFKGSPLVPAGASDHAESSYRFGGPA